MLRDAAPGPYQRQGAGGASLRSLRDSKDPTGFFP